METLYRWAYAVGREQSAQAQRRLDSQGSLTTSERATITALADALVSSIVVGSIVTRDGDPATAPDHQRTAIARTLFGPVLQRPNRER